MNETDEINQILISKLKAPSDLEHKDDFLALCFLKKIVNYLWLTPNLDYIEGIATGPTGKYVSVRFLVDSGATYTLLGEPDWRQIELQPKRSLTFTLADGTTVERQVSECHLSLPQGEGHTPVILGQPGDEPLLGAVTLEVLGLVLNPFQRTLQPMRMLLI
jgi:predicted aspartyl protease